RQILPLAGARCLERLDDADTVGLLRGVGAQAGVALLRYFGAERRKTLLAQLPTALTLAFEMLLGYPEGAVGAWMDPRVLALPGDMTAGESLERVRRADDALVADPYVIDRNQRLLGYVELADLLRADAATTLARLMRASPHRLPAQAMLAGLREHTGWREASALPVVERGDRLVGALTHAALQRALSLEQSAPPVHGTDDTLAGIAGAYWFGVSALIHALVELLPVERSEGDA
ncbi:MAG: CBS domain-containing protein, partial [Pseudomonadota bacterium]